MIKDWIEAIRQQDESLMITSLESQLMAFAAEENRKTGKIVEL